MQEGADVIVWDCWMPTNLARIYLFLWKMFQKTVLFQDLALFSKSKVTPVRLKPTTKMGDKLLKFSWLHHIDSVLKGLRMLWTGLLKVRNREEWSMWVLGKCRAETSRKIWSQWPLARYLSSLYNIRVILFLYLILDQVYLLPLKSRSMRLHWLMHS